MYEIKVYSTEEIRQYIKDKIEYFKQRLYEIGIYEDCLVFTKIKTPGSIKHHHNKEYGLLAHTYEVMKICESIASILCFTSEQEDELLFLAMIHDLGKIYEYEFDYGNGEWFKTDFGSHVDWIYYRLYGDERVSAKRLAAHHGKVEWGSRLEPFDKISWALHLADMISAKCI